MRETAITGRLLNLRTGHNHVPKRLVEMKIHPGLVAVSEVLICGSPMTNVEIGFFVPHPFRGINNILHIDRKALSTLDGFICMAGNIMECLDTEHIHVGLVFNRTANGLCPRSNSELLLVGSPTFASTISSLDSLITGSRLSLQWFDRLTTLLLEISLGLYTGDGLCGVISMKMIPFVNLGLAIRFEVPTGDHEHPFDYIVVRDSSKSPVLGTSFAPDVNSEGDFFSAIRWIQKQCRMGDLEMCMYSKQSFIGPFKCSTAGLVVHSPPSVTIDFGSHESLIKLYINLITTIETLCINPHIFCTYPSCQGYQEFGPPSP